MQDEDAAGEASGRRRLSPVQRAWRECFTRPFKDVSRWDNTLFHSASSDGDSLGRLFSDCFSHHNTVRYAPFDEKQFHFQDDPKRIVRRDNLTAYFQYRFYSGAEGYPQAPIYESPNYLSDGEKPDPPVTFDHFYRSVTAIPFDPDDHASPTLGENRITFLIGQVGVGKTFMLSQIARRIAADREDAAGFTVLPVYVDFESFVLSNPEAEAPSELVRRFLLHLHHLVVQAVTQFARDLIRQLPHDDPSVSTPAGTVALNIAELARMLARSTTDSARLVIFVDNLDVLHYRGSRYIFFPEEYSKHRLEVEEKIAAIIFLFLDEGLLGDAGLCVCIAARDNVARDIRLINHGAQPKAAQLSDHSVFQLGAMDPSAVVQSRLNLLQEALSAYSGADLGKHLEGRDVSEQLGLLLIRMGGSVADTNIDDGLRRISALSHHGSRSLIDFLGKLTLNPLQQRAAVERLFGHSPWLLERLYIANGRERFAQTQGHFPNLFLVDGTVSERVIPDVLHKHTYWLKYLLLRAVGASQAGTSDLAGEVPAVRRFGISVEDLLERFVDAYGFEERIVRLALGSLAMVNESRCIEIAGASREDCHDNVVKLTSRGRMLIGLHPTHRRPYCFEWSYLQMVIDDHLLSLPREWADQIAVDTSLGFALKDEDAYYSAMASDLRKKLPATLTFVRVLEAAWSEECRTRPLLDAVRDEIGPDFSVIYSSLGRTIRAVTAQARLDADRYIDLMTSLRGDPRFDDAMKKYSAAHQQALEEVGRPSDT